MEGTNSGNASHIAQEGARQGQWIQWGNSYFRAADVCAVTVNEYNQRVDVMLFGGHTCYSTYSTCEEAEEAQRELVGMLAEYDRAMTPALDYIDSDDYFTPFDGWQEDDLTPYGDLCSKSQQDTPRHHPGSG